jgi:hypothetical protein
VAQGQRCNARYTPAGQLDELVWADLCALLADPAQVACALERARGGAWLPQELQARQATLRQALGQLERQQQRLLDAYLAEVVELAELEHKRQELDRRRATLLTQQRQLDAIAEQRLELRAVADGIEAFCQTVRSRLATATFAQRRLLVELLIDRVVVTDGEVEIRYVLPTSPDGPHPPFCHLRKDHLDHPPLGVQRRQLVGGRKVRVKDRGHQPVAVHAGPPARIRNGVLHHPNGDRLAMRGAQVRTPRPVSKDLLDRQLGGGLAAAPDPPHQLRAGQGHLPPQLGAGNQPVGQQQHPRAKRPALAGKLARQRLLTAAVGTLGGVQDRVRARLHQPHHPDLRECAHSLPRPLLARPNAWFVGLSGTSRQVPSRTSSRHPRYHAPRVALVASGRAAWANSTRSGSGPSRSRASASAEAPGTCQYGQLRRPRRACCAQPSPSTRQRITSS